MLFANESGLTKHRKFRSKLKKTWKKKTSSIIILSTVTNLMEEKKTSRELLLSLILRHKTANL